MSGVEIAAAASIISGAYGIYSGVQQKKSAEAASKEQKQMAQRNAARTEAETMEQKRRAEQEASEQMARTRAKAGASGIKPLGSMDIFMGSEEDKFNREIDWLVKSGASKASLEKASGYSQARQTKSAGESAMYSSLGSGLGKIGSGASDWWTAQGGQWARK